MSSRREEKPTKASVGVGVIVVRGGKLLLMKRTGSHGEGTWSAPGGHIDFGETLEDTAIRETKEEVGLDVVRPQFAAITNDVFPNDDRHYITVWMKAEYAGGEPNIASERELTDVGWFFRDELPQPLFVPLQNFVDGKHYPKEVDVWTFLEE